MLIRFLIIASSVLLLTSCGSDDTRSEIIASWLAEERSGGVMMVGDSITNRWPDELRPCGAFNRGIDGDTTAGVLERLWLIEQEQPDDIILMIGINDIAGGLGYRVVPNVQLIVDELKTSTPGAQISILSILYSDYADSVEVDEINAQLALIGVDFQLVYLDRKYTPDGTHPNYSGYELLLEQISCLPNAAEM